MDAITPELQRLADDLQRDPTQIYAYVRNMIVYEHYYGAKKGAMLTWLEGSGNDFDQAALLVALLRAAGYPAQYRAGHQRIPYADTVNGNDLVQWLGLAPQALTHLTWSEALAQHGWSQRVYS